MVPLAHPLRRLKGVNLSECVHPEPTHEESNFAIQLDPKSPSLAEHQSILLLLVR